MTTSRSSRPKSAKIELMPAPTYWVKHSPDGEPPLGVCLLLKAYKLESEDEEGGQPILELGSYSPKLHTFVTLDNEAIEETAEVDSYHIIHNVDGSLWEL